MREWIKVFDGMGSLQFSIHRPSGVCQRNGECNPRRMEDFMGNKVLTILGSRHGLCGEMFTWYRVGRFESGDVVRHVELPAGHPSAADFASWWEVVSSRFDENGERLQTMNEYLEAVS